MTDTTNMTGEQFAQALADLGWRQVEFANRTGVGAVTVNRWISGHLPVPTWAQRHVELLLAADQFHRLHVAPPLRPKRRKAGTDTTTEGEAA